jgi:hypothetical protein
MIRPARYCSVTADGRPARGAACRVAGDAEFRRQRK